MKYLIACLGNIGIEYENTRHNIGFMIADNLIKDSDEKFTTNRLAQTALIKFKGRSLFVIKPTTYMNLSGKAVQYWMRNENIPLENLLVVVDDISLPTATLRMKKKGSDAGHNGLINIIETLGTNEYARLRFGIGNDFPRGRQADYVLGKFTPSEMDLVNPKLDAAVEMIKCFATQGVDKAMNLYNNK